MESEWEKIDKKVIDELFNNNFDESQIRGEYHTIFQYAKWKANHLGGVWEDYFNKDDIFNFKIEVLEDLGYLPSDLI